MQEININELSFNPFTLIGKKWCLISAVKEDGTVNTMTASWGGVGVMWNKNVATIYVRPQRYTKEFIDEAAYFTLSFFDEKYRSVLNYCGKNSGRDTDKVKECNLHVQIDESVTFEEAELSLVCKKLYHAPILESGFIDQKLSDQNYPDRDFHEMYIGEIVKVIK